MLGVLENAILVSAGLHTFLELSVLFQVVRKISFLASHPLLVGGGLLGLSASHVAPFLGVYNRAASFLLGRSLALSPVRYLGVV